MLVRHGAAFLEDIRRTDGATLRQVDIRERMEHMWSGSWREKDKETEAWLNKHESLWKPSPREMGIKDVALHSPTGGAIPSGVDRPPPADGREAALHLRQRTGQRTRADV